MTWECFLLEPTTKAIRFLRRYEPGDCPAQPGRGYHNAMVRIEDGVIVEGADHTISTVPRDWPHDDPRWPAACACGHAFTAAGQRQLFFDRLYRLPDGRECELREAPPGAMWYADWYSWKGPDGRSLALMTPGGDWLIDGPASGSGTPWRRTGVPPKVTVEPSILFTDGSFHGIVRDGVLIPV